MVSVAPQTSYFVHTLSAQVLALTGGARLVTLKVVEGSPEGNTAGNTGDIRVDRISGVVYVKGPGASPLTGWSALASDADVPARSFFNVADYDVLPDGTDVTDGLQSVIDIASSAGGGIVFMPPGTYPVTDTLILRSNVRIEGYGAVLLAEHAQTSFAMEDDTQIWGLFITSPYTLPISNYPDPEVLFATGARRIVCGSRCKFVDVTMSYCAGGVRVEGVDDVVFVNFSFSNLRSYIGSAQGINCYEATSVVGIGIFGELSDRGIECEDGSTLCSFTGGRLEGIFPNGFPGQPVDYLTYTFVLDAHSHDGTSRVQDISYRDFVVTGCYAGITCVLSGVDDEFRPMDCTFEAIRLQDSLDRPPIQVDAIGTRIRDCVVTGTFPDALVAQACNVLGGDDNYIDVRYESYRFRAVRVQANATRTVLRGFIGDPTGSGVTYYAVEVEGSYTDVEMYWSGVVNRAGLVHIAAGAVGCSVRGTMAFIVGDGVTYGVHVQGSYASVGPLTIEGDDEVDVFVDPSPAVPTDMFAVIRDVLARKNSGNLVALAASAEACVVHDCVANTSSSPIVNSGNNNRIYACVTGSLERDRAPTIMVSNYNRSGDSGLIYIPWGSLNEDANIGSLQCQFLALFPGSIEYVAVWSNSNSGDTTIGIHLDGDTTPEQEQTVVMSSVSAIAVFDPPVPVAAGQLVAVSINPTLDHDNVRVSVGARWQS